MLMGVHTPAGLTPIARAVCRSSRHCEDVNFLSHSKLHTYSEAEFLLVEESKSTLPRHPSTFNIRNGDAQPCPTVTFHRSTQTQTLTSFGAQTTRSVHRSFESGEFHSDNLYSEKFLFFLTKYFYSHFRMYRVIKW